MKMHLFLRENDKAQSFMNTLPNILASLCLKYSKFSVSLQQRDVKYHLGFLLHRVKEHRAGFLFPCREAI
jgi:hypothetical protein